MKHIVKRKGHKEKFDERKIYAACYSAAVSCCKMPKREAEEICEKVCKDMKKWVKDKESVTSNQIFKQTIKTIRKYNKETAFMFETHRDIS